MVLKSPLLDPEYFLFGDAQFIFSLVRTTRKEPHKNPGRSGHVKSDHHLSVLTMVFRRLDLVGSLVKATASDKVETFDTPGSLN